MPCQALRILSKPLPLRWFAYLVLFIIALRWPLALAHNTFHLWLNHQIINTARTSHTQLHLPNKIIQLISDNDRSNWLEAYALWVAGQTDEATYIWQNLPQTEQNLIIMARMARVNHNYSQALAWLDLTHQLYPTLADVWYEKGLVYEQLGDYANAAQYWQNALSPELTFQVSSAAETHCMLGWYYHWLAVPPNPSTALHHYTLALNEATTITNPALCFIRRAELYLWALDQPDLAILDYETGLVLGAYPYPSQVNLVWAQFRQGQSGDQTEAKLYQLLSTYPNSILIYQRLLQLYAQQQQPTEALTLLHNLEATQQLTSTERQQLADLWATLNP